MGPTTRVRSKFDQIYSDRRGPSYETRPTPVEIASLVVRLAPCHSAVDPEQKVQLRGRLVVFVLGENTFFQNELVVERNQPI